MKTKEQLRKELDLTRLECNDAIAINEMLYDDGFEAELIKYCYKLAIKRPQIAVLINVTSHLTREIDKLNDFVYTQLACTIVTKADYHSRSSLENMNEDLNELRDMMRTIDGYAIDLKDSISRYRDFLEKQSLLTE